MNAKGTRDFPPEDKILREDIVDRLKSIFRLYGYNPLETPVIERADILTAKYAGGAEILKESFTLTDQGKRNLMLRYDLTVPFARFVGMNPTLKMPFKRYQIGRSFRDGPIKLGRYREFWQCDVDVVGTSSMMAEAELMAIAERFFRDIGFDITIKVNNRKVLNSLITYAGIDEGKSDDVILSLDKLEKVGPRSVRKELAEKKIEKKSIDRILGFFDEYDGTINYLETNLGTEGIEELKELFMLTDALGLKNTKLDVTLARGLSYYTGTIYEIFLNSENFTSAIAAGGRYDRMIGEFLGGKQQYPAVGISFGLEGIMDIIKMQQEERKKSVVEFFIIPIGDVKTEALKLAQELRNKDLNADLDIMGRSISKNLDFANKNTIPYVLFVGENEIKEGKFKIKDMNAGKEWMIEKKKLADELKKYQKIGVSKKNVQKNNS